MKPETIAIHAGNAKRDGAAAAPIHLSTTFEHGPANEPIHDFTYVRDANPNVDDLETRLAAMEGADGSVAFASGMAAGAAVLATLPPGARVLFHQDLYFDYGSLCREVLAGRGLETATLDLADEAALAAELERGAALVWFETPSNPRLDLLDIAKISAAARAAGADVLVDGTFATPVLQRPLDLGATYVLHSLTKYMGGHSDVQGGSVAFRGDADAGARLKRVRKLTGGVLAPFNAWLIARGLQTLHVRMERHCANAAAVASMLDAHPKVERARYPFLASHPGSDLARRQMAAGGGMASFDVKGGREAALRVAANLKLFLNATSLGGVESLVEHRASVEEPAPISPPGLLRLSVGLEHADDLIADLEQALEHA